MACGCHATLELCLLQRALAHAYRESAATRLTRLYLRIVLHFESDQLILLNEVSGRDWEFSFMTTHVSGDNEVDFDAFLNTALRGLPVNSQIYNSELVHLAAYAACEENC